MVCDLFSSLVAHVIKNARYTDGSRNITQKLLDKNELEIIALANKFKVVKVGSDGVLYIPGIETVGSDNSNIGKQRHSAVPQQRLAAAPHNFTNVYFYM